MTSPTAKAEATTASTLPETEDKMEVGGESGDVTTTETPATPSTPAAAADAADAATGNGTPSASTPQTGAAGTNASTPAKSGPPSAVEFEPPVACVRRILKKTLPSSSNVGKDAVAAFARASGIFIIYLTACANDFARENRRQTITANDVLAAIKELEFEEFAPELTAFLEGYRKMEKNKKDAKAKAAAERAKEANEDKPDEDGGTGSAATDIGSTPSDKSPKAKEEDDDDSTSPQPPKGEGDDDEDDKTNTNDADGDVSMDQDDEDGNNNGEEAGEDGMAE